MTATRFLDVALQILRVDAYGFATNVDGRNLTIMNQTPYGAGGDPQMICCLTISQQARGRPGRRTL